MATSFHVSSEVSSTKDLIAVTALTAVVMYLAAGAQSELKMMEKSILKKHWHKKVHSDQGSIWHKKLIF
jgi:hypothetical protein